LEDVLKFKWVSPENALVPLWKQPRSQTSTNPHAL
jgi:hypothetical protein